MTETDPPAANNEEPSIEEILASIRKIISDEPEKGAEEVADSAQSIAAEVEQILDLSPEPESPLPDLSSAAVEDEEVMDLSLDDLVAPPPPPAPQPQPAPVTAPPAMPSTPQPATAPLPLADGGILSNATAAAVSESMQKLTDSAHNPFMQNTVLVGIRTIEQVVEDLMRPMLRDWCDNHLPKIVERAVERELARLARRVEERI